jgi:hypothetical protein
MAYQATCKECGKRFYDSHPECVYVVPLDLYFCSEACWDKWRKKPVKEAKP